MIEDRFERGEAPIVHIRGSERHITQGWYSHRPLTRAVVGESRFSGVALSVAPGAGKIEAGVTIPATDGGRGFAAKNGEGWRACCSVSALTMIPAITAESTATA